MYYVHCCVFLDWWCVDYPFTIVNRAVDHSRSWSYDHMIIGDQIRYGEFYHHQPILSMCSSGCRWRHHNGLFQKTAMQNSRRWAIWWRSLQRASTKRWMWHLHANAADSCNRAEIPIVLWKSPLLWVYSCSLQSRCSYALSVLQNSWSNVRRGGNRKTEKTSGLQWCHRN